MAETTTSSTIVSHTFTDLENDKIYYVRVFPRNPKGDCQSELDGQWASATPKEG